MKKARPYLITAFVVAVLIFVKFIFFAPEKSKAAGSKNSKKPPTPVTVFVIGEAELEDKLYASGTIVANESSELKAEASGNITYINFPEGNTVSAGTLLLKVNDADLRAQFDKIKIQLKLAEDSEKRLKNLLQVSGVSQQEYDVALSNLHSLKADSAYHQAQIAKTEVRAPFNGVVGIRNVSLGSYITPATTVAQIHQISLVKIDFSIPEKYSSLFKVGDIIKFQTEGLNTNYQAKITVKDPLIELNTRNVRYRAVTSNPRSELMPGAFARVELSLKDKPNTIFVPTEAIIPVLKGKKVYVLNAGLAEEKLVETGLRTEDHVQILSGLSTGDSVVVNGNFQLKNGSPVKVVSEKKK